MFLSEAKLSEAYVDLDAFPELLEAGPEIVVDAVQLLASHLVELLRLFNLLNLKAFLLPSFLFFEDLGSLDSRVHNMLLLDMRVHVDDREQLLELFHMVLVSGRKEGLVEDILNEIGMELDHLIEVFSLRYLVLEHFPATLQHLDHDVVVDIAYEVEHLVSVQRELVEVSPHFL